MESIVFSIIVVCLNPGEKLERTLESILNQTEKSLEVIIKDGNSTDGAVEKVQKKYADYTERPIHIIRQPDTGIYDAMNQAAAQAVGEFLLFLNCGDRLDGEGVLSRVRQSAGKRENKIFYGHITSRLTQTVVPSNPRMDAFGCYRNVPCHQACFYRRELFAERGYLLQYKVRADYEHFLWSFFEKQANPVCLTVVVAEYEGGGFSETKENRKQSAKEHKEITKKYMSRAQRFKFKAILWITLAPLRSKMAESRHFSKVYNGLKQLMYR